MDFDPRKEGMYKLSIYKLVLRFTTELQEILSKHILCGLLNYKTTSTPDKA